MERLVGSRHLTARAAAGIHGGSMPFSLPPRRTLFEVAETLAIALAGGVTFALLELPAGLVSGSVLAVATAALLGRPMRMPLELGAGLLRHRRYPARHRGYAGHAARGDHLAREHCAVDGRLAHHDAGDVELSARRAPLGSVVGADGSKPGAMAQVIALSTELGGDLRAIAIVQTVRVLLLVVGLPNGLALFGLVVPAVAPVRGPADFSVLGQMLLLAAVATAFAVVF